MKMKMKIISALLMIIASFDARGSELTESKSYKRYLSGNITLPHEGCLGLVRDHVPTQLLVTGSGYEHTNPTGRYRVGNELGTTAAKCINGTAAGYPCSNVDLLSALDLGALNFDSDAVPGNDLWGWDKNGREFALMGIETATVFVEITDPYNPVIVGKLPSHTGKSWWRDIKTMGSYALIVSEANDHGMQIFHLDKLLSARAKTVFTEDAHYDEFGHAHNVFVNEDTHYAYALGSNTCDGGLHIVDVSSPKNPVKAGCYTDDGYTHDVQCVVYNGPDNAYKGREICFASNANKVTILDVQNKSDIRPLGAQSYSNFSYTHQGWLTEDHATFVFGDELDEMTKGFNTRTHVIDIKVLGNPIYKGFHDGRSKAIDHNLYIKGNFVHQANYRAGYNLLEIVDAAEARFKEKGYFDIYPPSDSRHFNGAWSTYPYFPSGNVIVSGLEQGLFVLDPKLDQYSKLDQCVGLEKKACRSLKQDKKRVCVYNMKKKIKLDCVPQNKKFNNLCSKFTTSDQCGTRKQCRWQNSICSHKCDGLNKNLCSQERLNGKRRICKMTWIPNPCHKCKSKSRCKN